MQRFRFHHVVAIAVCLAIPMAAHAKITETHRLTDFTAYTLNEEEVQIGLGSVKYGISDRFELGTVFLADIFTIFNLYGGVTLVDSDSFGLGAHVSAAYFNPSMMFGGPNANIILPALTLTGSLRFTDGVYLHLSPSVAYGIVSGDELEADDFDTVNGFQFAGVSAHTVLEIDVNETGAVLFDVTLPVLSMRSTEDVAVADIADNIAATVSYQFSWDLFNLRLGAGYNANDPFDLGGVQVVLDLYWRWKTG